MKNKSIVSLENIFLFTTGDFYTQYPDLSYDFSEYLRNERQGVVHTSATTEVVSFEGQPDANITGFHLRVCAVPRRR